MRLTAIVPVILMLSPLQAENPLRIDLISDTATVQPGKPFQLGLHLKHPPESHTYWKFPGAVGLATSVKWKLPAGFHAGEIQWPAPQVVLMAGHAAQGYEGETLLIIPLTPPSDIPLKKVELTAQVSWMCCGSTCEPAVDVPLSITLNVSSSAHPQNEALFAKFRDLVPQADPAWSTSVQRKDSKIFLRVKPPTEVLASTAIRFFTADGQIDSSAEQTVGVLPDGSFEVVLAVSEFAPAGAATLLGVLTIGANHRLVISPTFPEDVRPGRP